MRSKAILAALLIAALGMAVPAGAGDFDKTGQAGMTFLKIGPNARAAGMGDAFTAASTGAAATFYNPAGLGFLRGKFEATGGMIQWIADINVTAAALGVPLSISGGDPDVVVGVSFVTMDYGTIYGTVIDNDQQYGYREINELEPSEMAIGLTFARQFTDKFSLGVTAKYVSQGLPWYDTGGGLWTPTAADEESSVYAIAWDAGTVYRTGIGSSVISMSIRNFARSVEHIRDSYRLPMTFNIGVSMDVLDLAPDLQNSGHRLLVAVDGIHPSDHPEKLSIGGEYSFSDMIFVRGGYGFNQDARTFSAGAGIRYSIAGVGAAFDYAMSDFGEALGMVNYFTLSFFME